MRLSILLMLCSLSVAAAPARAAEVTGADSLIREMYHRYQDNWYSTMKFTQKSTTYNVDGTTKVETWYEAALLPGKLRIDFGSPSGGDAAILTDGRVFIYKDGKLVVDRKELNLLLVLGFDVYGQPPETTLAQLKSEGIDLSKFHEDTWEGERVYVVGAEKGDLKSKQFWIEKKRLLFVRIIEPSDSDPSQLDDVRFLNYRQLSKGWIAERVEVYNDGKLTFSEDYSEVQTGQKLEPSLFDPKAFESQHGPK
jgi:outer membrane lipoprotein-sorting protein